jgi:hypothetical protein
MGKSQAMEMVKLLQQEQALIWHLQYNHYPPISPIFFDTAKEAIELADEGDWDSTITMPNGVSMTVGGIIEGLHLDSFLDDLGEEVMND